MHSDNPYALLAQSNPPILSPRSAGCLSPRLTLRTPKERAPRRSITSKQAIDSLQLAITQANDLQHLFEKYLQQIDEKATALSMNIDHDFDEIVSQLMQRKTLLKQQINGWRSERWMTVSNEISNACEYEEKCLEIQKQCDSVLRNDKLMEKQKQDQIKNIKRFALDANDARFKKYNDSKELTTYINDTTRLIDVTYNKNTSLDTLSTYGKITTDSSNRLLSIPVLNLLKPIKGRENGITQYELKLKWSVSQPLIADHFVIRCLSTHIHEDDNKGDTYQHNNSKLWQSLLFNIEANKACTEFMAYDIQMVFSLDISYRFRIEYHITDPVNLLIGSNEETFVIRDIEPSADKVSFIELEYHSSNGYSYEGHPNHLLSPDPAKKYRSKHNKEFDYNENDWIIFKVKHSGFIRTYLPKVVLIQNHAGTQALRELALCIGDKGDGNEWHRYNVIEFENHSQQQKMLLTGVDWKIVKQMKTQFIKLELLRNHGESRGAQCRFKVDEFVLYGLEI